MKTVTLEKSDLPTCAEKAKGGRVVVMRDRKPVALLVNVEGLDREQLELGSSDHFWRLIEEHRKQKTLTRADLEKCLERLPRHRRG